MPVLQTTGLSDLAPDVVEEEDCSGWYHRRCLPVGSTADLQGGGAPENAEATAANASKKQEMVRCFIRRLEGAFHLQKQEDEKLLHDVADPKDPSFRTLVTVLLSQKYADFAGLLCTVLRAMQMVLRFAVFKEMAGPNGELFGSDHNIGMSCFRLLAGEELARAAVPQVVRLALPGSSEDVIAEAVLSHNALLVLAELGPEATAAYRLETQLATRVLDSFQTLPDRAAELVEVALRMHAWGRRHRKALLKVTVAHDARIALGEVLIQVVNRCDGERRHRAIKVLKSCLMMPTSANMLFTNDALVLVEILLRELPNQVHDEFAFAEHVDCFKVLAWRCEAVREHRRDELVELMTDLSMEELNPAGVRAKSTEMLSLLSKGGRWNQLASTSQCDYPAREGGA